MLQNSLGTVQSVLNHKIDEKENKAKYDKRIEDKNVTRSTLCICHRFLYTK